MKITEVTTHTIHTIFTDEIDPDEYTRFSANNWMVTMGESLESVYDCEELERKFQEFISDK